VTSNTDRANALSEILSIKPDCVLLDMMMPGIDGLEVCRTLRDKKGMEETKIIMVSGKAYEFDRKRAYEFGADGYITKPLKEKTFVAEVERIPEDKVILSFWGVHGTLPVPGEKTVKYGGNTSCVTLDFLRDQNFIFDAGSGIKKLSDWLLANKRAKIEAKIFIYHPHWDHINALPFFVPLYMPGNEFEIFGARHGDVTTRELVSA
jgi:CheY-like chemotaxis protein